MSEEPPGDAPTEPTPVVPPADATQLLPVVPAEPVEARAGPPWGGWGFDAAPGAARKPHPAPVGHPRERVANGRLVVVDDRIPVRRLVAREPERVEGERVLVGCRALLLDQAAEHAELDGISVHYTAMPARYFDSRYARYGFASIADPVARRSVSCGEYLRACLWTCSRSHSRSAPN